MGGLGEGYVMAIGSRDNPTFGQSHHAGGGAARGGAEDSSGPISSGVLHQGECRGGRPLLREGASGTDGEAHASIGP